ncbi:Polyprenol monophosphomannose synthase [Leucobacter aridicollis]|uniref:polyprenol monophosphomannose synthase n=1 Tax=Leucobacter aridicollis TaxID=283878 RepID=UPI0037C857E4
MQHPVVPESVTHTSVLVVLPTFNERDSLAGVVAAVLDAVPGANVLIIDDNSPDGTGDVADGLASADTRVSVMHRAGKLGLGTAYIAGFQRGLDLGYEFVAEMDSDGSHLPGELPALLNAAAAGAELVIGTRWMPGGTIVNWPRHRRMLSRGGTAFARFALRSRLRDLTSGYRVLSRGCVERLGLERIDSEGYAFQVETAWRIERLGVPVAEVPITFVERTTGRSKMSARIMWEAFTNVLRWGISIRGAREPALHN